MLQRLCFLNSGIYPGQLGCKPTDPFHCRFLSVGPRARKNLSVFVGFYRFLSVFLSVFRKCFFYQKSHFFIPIKFFFFNVYSPENIKRLFEQKLTATHTGEPGFRTMDPSKVLNIFRRSDSDHLNKKHIVSKCGKRRF